MNYLIWNGRDSREIKGLIICELPPITKPQMRVAETVIDGVDGSIIENLGFSTYDKAITIGVTQNADIDEITGYFTGTGDVVFSNETSKYYKATIINQIDYARLVRYRTATIVFRAQPYKYEYEENVEVIEPANLFDFSKWYANNDKLSVTGGNLAVTENSLTLDYSGSILLGTFSASATPTEADIETIKTFGIEVDPNTLYTLSMMGDNNGDVMVMYYDSEYSYKTRALTYLSGVGTHNFSFTTPDNCKYVCLRITNQSYGENTQLTVSSIKIMKGAYVDEAHIINKGNTKATPIIEIEGEGKISVGVNHNSVFEYNFPDGENTVIIDGQKQDAYLETILKNRNMVGEFPTFEIGENQVFWSGNIKSIKISSYGRWL